jgi:DTW domain-containing protein YfiP
MRSHTPASLPGRCKRCYLQEAFCACAILQPRRIRPEIVVLRHPYEAWKTTNTARWAALMLEGCRVEPVYSRGEPAIDEAASLPGTFLLFPGAERAPAPHEVKRLIAVDGTWRQASRIVGHSERLKSLPRLSVAPIADAPRLREATAPDRLTTIEAIGAALALLDEPTASEALLAASRELTRRVFVARGMPERAERSSSS